ncbi:MAG: UpxY family transcription antiterminator [Nitrospirae bacterium]|nr:UpxY family transcription antiterminator [Nitrospirota bacterium]
MIDINRLMWFVVHVRNRHEFTVRDKLAKTGVDVFLATVERLQRWKDRKKMINFPLFPGYLFVNIHKTNEEILSVLKTYGVIKFLSMTIGEPEPVPEDQVMSLKKLVESKASIDPYPYFKEGQSVRIKKGPLSGVEGIIEKKKGYHILILSIDILQQGVSIKIDASDVEFI